MGVRSIVRDSLFIFIGFQLMLPQNWEPLQLFFIGLFIFLFSCWFMLERLGLIPKPGR